MHPAELGTGFDAEFLDQDLAGLPEDLQCLRRPPAAIERGHQQHAQGLAQRELADQPGQLRRQLHMATQREHRRRPVFHGRQPQLRETLALELCEGARNTGKRLPAPQIQRGIQRFHRRLVIPGRELLSSLLAQPVEDAHIQGFGRQLQRVTGGLRDQDTRGRPARTIRLQTASQPRNIGINAAFRASRRRLTPQRVDEFVPGHDVVGMQRQHREHRSLSGRTESDLVLPQPGARRSQQLDFERATRARQHNPPIPSFEQIQRHLQTRALLGTNPCPTGCVPEGLPVFTCGCGRTRFSAATEVIDSGKWVNSRSSDACGASSNVCSIERFAAGIEGDSRMGIHCSVGGHRTVRTGRRFREEDMGSWRPCLFPVRKRR